MLSVLPFTSVTMLSTKRFGPTTFTPNDCP